MGPLKPIFSVCLDPRNQWVETSEVFCSLFTHLIQKFGTWVVGFPVCYKRSQVPTLFPWLLMKPPNLVTISISHKLCMPLILLMYAYMHGLCQTILFPMVLIPSPTIAFWCFPNLTLTHLDLPFAFNQVCQFIHQPRSSHQSASQRHSRISITGFFSNQVLLALRPIYRCSTRGHCIYFEFSSILSSAKRYPSFLALAPKRTTVNWLKLPLTSLGSVNFSEISIFFNLH